MKLTTYLAERNITEAEFAALVGVDRSTVNRYRSGAAKPSLEVLAKIVEATGGAVSVRDFVASEEAA